MRFKTHTYIHTYIMSFCAALALTAFTPAQAQPQTTQTYANTAPARQGPTKIVFLGDSLTSGLGVPRGKAWPEQVQKRLASAGYNTVIVNAGVSGDNSANGLARYDRSVGSAQADVLVLALGANDFLQGVSPQRTQANLSAIITRAQASGLSVILAGVSTPQLKRLGPIGRAYGSIYPNLARKHNLPLFPSILKDVSTRRSLLQRDGLHPNQKGAEVMADNFAPYLGGVLDQRR